MLKPKLTANLSIHSTEPRETLATKLSKEIFAGIPFVETDAYDEVPCMFLYCQIMGLNVYLFGDARETDAYLAKYHLSLYSSSDHEETVKIDLSIYLAQLITTKLGLNCCVLE